MFINSWASRRVVKVSIFGNGLSTAEWTQLLSSPWRHHGDFVVKLVDDPSQADVLAMHGPLTELSLPFMRRWLAQRQANSKLLWVGLEAGEPSAEWKIDLIVAGSPPAPNVLKSALEQVLWGHQDV